MGATGEREWGEREEGIGCGRGRRREGGNGGGRGRGGEWREGTMPECQGRSLPAVMRGMTCRPDTIL